MEVKRWLVYALLSAGAAAMVGIFGKVGMSQVDSTLATAVRSAVMTAFLLGLCTVMGLWEKLPSMRGRAVMMIVFSGLAGAVSWLFYFKAIKLATVAQVAPIDKLSMPLAVLLAVIILGDRPSAWNWLGVALIVGGAYLAALPAAVAGAEVKAIVSQEREAIRSVEIGADRAMRVNGRPFVPIFAWWVHEEELAALAESGVNVAMSPRATARYADACFKLGMYVGGNPREELRGHRGLLFWLQEDEPDIHIADGPRLDKAEEANRTVAVGARTLIERVQPGLEQRLKQCKSLDAARPVFLNFSYLFLPRFWGTEAVSRELYAAIAKASDVVSWDIYPIADWGREDFLPLILTGTRRLRGLAPQKPAYAFIECARWRDLPRTRQPRAEEMRNEVWQALVGGATGIGWFTYGLDVNDAEGKKKLSFGVSDENRVAMKRINEEVRLNTAAIVAPEVFGAMRLAADGLPEVAVSLRVDDGHCYLAAVNTRYEPRRLDWESLTEWHSGDAAAVASAKAAFAAAMPMEIEGLGVRILESVRGLKVQ